MAVSIKWDHDPHGANLRRSSFHKLPPPQAGQGWDGGKRKLLPPQAGEGRDGATYKLLPPQAAEGWDGGKHAVHLQDFLTLTAPRFKCSLVQRKQRTVSGSLK